MFKAIRKWWDNLGKLDEELARHGLYHYTNAYGQPVYIQREPNDRQKTHKRTSKKSKG